MATKTPAATVLLLWLVVVASSPRAALGNDNCRNGCNAACMGWAIVCQISCASACLGQSEISTMSTAAAAKHPAASAPAPSPQQQLEGGGVFVLRKGLLKPSAAAAAN